MVSTDHGLMIVNRFDHDQNQVGHAQWLLDHGNSDSIEAFICIRLLESIHQPVMFDIGANIGTITTLVANVLRSCEIYCFEPQHDVFKILCGNLAINNLDNCRAYNIALGNKNTTVEIREPDYFSPNDFGIFSLIENKIPVLSNKTIMVDVCTVDDFVAKHHIEKIDLIKIDAEGMDFAVLEGARLIIEKYNPRIFIEHSDNKKSNLDKIQNFLGHEKYNFMIIRNNLLAVPREYLTPDFRDLLSS